MKLKFFSKVNSYKRFHFNPRIYDERKERIEAMVAKYKDQQDISVNQRRENLKLSISDTWGRGEYRQKQTKSSNIRIILIILLITLGIYLIFNNSSGSDVIVHKLK
jgi:hypothetical protein